LNCCFNSGKLLLATVIHSIMTNNLHELINKLIHSSRAWAAGAEIDTCQMARWREEAIKINHKHYFQKIPAYRQLVLEEGFSENADFATIRKHLMLSADIFKSYDQAWLNEGNFSRMTDWLSGIFHRRIDIDPSPLKTMDEWIDELATNGIHVVYSSGTSGAFSFVPRELADRELSRKANISYLSPLIVKLLIEALPGGLTKSAFRLIPQEKLTRIVADRSLSSFDAAFLGFRCGRMGNQALIEELAPLFNHNYFLYDTAITGTALRGLRSGYQTQEEHQLIRELKAVTSEHKEAGYQRLLDNLQQSTRKGRKVFIFGAPQQFLEMGEAIARNNKRLNLKRGSLALFGGGWKSFTGVELSRQSLVNMVTNTLGLPPEMVLEGYSMTEINVLMLRCKEGHFHIPPLIEPVIFNDELNPLEGEELTGAFGFLDPLGISYPGFIITGDQVTLTYKQCRCGLSGPSITTIGRLPGSEIKGCGGIMGSMQA